jgi:hypothetical protein
MKIQAQKNNINIVVYPMVKKMENRMQKAPLVGVFLISIKK